MCCYSDRKAKRVFLKSLGRRKTVVAWKLVTRKGKARCAPYQYHPGEHRTTVKRYNLKRPRGFHVYQCCPDLDNMDDEQVCLQVLCHVDDIIRLETRGCYNAQAVLTRIRITRKAWAEAGLPNVPRKRGKND